MNLPVYDCLIDESINDESGIYAISFVDAPANEMDFVRLARQTRSEFLSRNTQKQILTGVVLRPNQLIYRSDERMGEYYIKFSAEQIEKIAQKMMRTGLALHNTSHQHQSPLAGNYLTEMWIVEDPQNDKSQALGFAPLSKGTLMCSYKIDDRNYWDSQVMTGNVKGFSLEGFFFQQKEQTQTNKLVINQFKNKKMNKRSKKTGTLLSRVAQFFLDIQAVEKADATTSGTAYLLFTLADGKEVYVDAQGFATMNDEQLPAGEHPLADGNMLVVDDQGQFVETKEASAKITKPEQATAPQTLADQEQAAGTESIDVLKSKIVDLETKLAELAGLAKDANAEVQKLRRQSPSTMPVSAAMQTRKLSEMKRYEQMAQALSMTIRNNK